jgi:hypothetical protein
MSGSWYSVDGSDGPPPSAEIDVTRPHVARMYDYYLGGRDNYGPDRVAADKIIGLFPDTRLVARQNREFMRRAARVMAGSGVSQFIDLGSGLPTGGNLHEVVQEVNPGARVIYVDNDPIVLAHGRALLATNENTTVITADMRDPHTLLAHPELLELIDFDRPVGVLFVAVLHFVAADFDPPGLIGAFRERMASGSHLVVTHVTASGADPTHAAKAVDHYSAATAPLVFRSPGEIEGLFGGFQLLQPGVVPTWEWRADREDKATSPRILAGVGRLS